MKFIKSKQTCNQCGKQLKFIDWHMVCIKPNCPNYALQQIPMEEMPNKLK
jgi:hypothetical protein